MKRREFVTFLAASAVAVPATALARSSSRHYRLGSVTAALPLAPASPFGKLLIGALARRGYRLGQNLTYDARGAMGNEDDLGMTLRYQASAEVAKSIGIIVQALGVREPDDFDEAFAAMKNDPPDAILMVADSLTVLNRRRVFDFAAERRLPAICEYSCLARDGGLMAYGPDLKECIERASAMIDRVFRGARPADLPFEQPTRYPFALNLKTAKAAGFAMPTITLALADEVFE